MLIVVLNDGETFSDIEGCNVFYVPPHIESTEDIEQYIEDNAAVGLPVSWLHKVVARSGVATPSGRPLAT